MSINLLTSNRASFDLAGFPKFSASVTGFQLPEISIQTVDVPTRFNKGKEAGTEVEFTELSVEFLVDEDLTNWLEIYNWIISLGMPKDHEQYRGVNDRNSDGSLIVYSSHNNVLTKFNFYELFPTNLSGIEFTEEDIDTIYRKATVSFSLLYYEVA